MSTNFEQCLNLTLAWEGGFVDDPRDPGGATCHGVTLATYRHWTDNGSLGADDIRAIPRGVVAAIYSTGYWNATRCDALPTGVDLMVFDESVTAGCPRAIRLLQAAMGFPSAAIDGCIGPDTLAGAAKSDPAALIHTLADRQLAFYRSRAGFSTFGRGWTSRVQRRREAALGMTACAVA